MKTFAKVALCAAILAVVVALFLQSRNAERQPGQKEPSSSQAMPPVVSLPPSSNAQTDEPAEPVPVAAAQSDETIATHRMYMAHAPLRVPEVADPDSASNRRILQTMVQKALQKKAADAPANNP